MKKKGKEKKPEEKKLKPEEQPLKVEMPFEELLKLMTNKPKSDL